MISSSISSTASFTTSGLATASCSISASISSTPSLKSSGLASSSVLASFIEGPISSIALSGSLSTSSASCVSHSAARSKSSWLILASNERSTSDNSITSSLPSIRESMSKSSLSIKPAIPNGSSSLVSGCVNSSVLSIDELSSSMSSELLLSVTSLSSNVSLSTISKSLSLSVISSLSASVDCSCSVSRGVTTERSASSVKSISLLVSVFNASSFTASSSRSSVNRESNCPSSSIRIEVDSAISCSLDASSRLDFKRKMIKKMAIKNNRGAKIVNIKLEMEPVMARNISFNKPGPLKGGSSNASIC